MQVGEITAPAAGDEDFLADTVSVIQNNNSAPALASLNGTHQASRTGADYDRVELLFHRVA